MFLMNENGDCSPLVWKSKTLQQICKSVKTAKTRSLDVGMDDSIYMSRLLYGIYIGKSGENQHLPVEMYIDSKTLYDSIQSSKQIKEKTSRHIIAWIK